MFVCDMGDICMMYDVCVVCDMSDMCDMYDMCCVCDIREIFRRCFCVCYAVLVSANISEL